MIDFNLIPYVSLKGMGAASGLLYEFPMLILISDDSAVLYYYDLKAKTLSKTSLRMDGQLLEKQSKSEKRDLEAVTKYKDHIYVLASGSGEHRNTLVKVRANNDKRIQEISMTVFYKKLQKTTRIKPEDFNLEGFILREERALLFNRGNGPRVKNGVFEICNWKEKADQKIKFIPINLPKIQGVFYGFTDAIQVDSKIYFLAAAEGGESTYEDGEVLGSIIGILDAKTLQLESTQVITSEHKLEGIALYQQKPSEISFLLCEDPDDGGAETEIFKLTFQIDES